MDNFVLVAAGIILLWLLAIGFYFYTVRQQRELRESIEEIRKKLDEVEDDAA